MRDEEKTVRRAVQMIIITESMEIDDRLRKECMSAERHLGPVSVLAIERAHRGGRSGLIEGRIPFRSLRTWAGRAFAPTSGVIIKGIESVGKFAVHQLSQRAEIIWVHDPGLWPLVIWLASLRRAGVLKMLIWDLHELPDHGSAGWRGAGVRKALQVADCVITTNTWRRNFLIDNFGARPASVVCLENYPDRAATERPPQSLPDDLIAWLHGRPYILAQGGAGAIRHAPSLVEAARRLETPIVFVGKPHDGGRPDLVFNTGWIPQRDVYRFIDHAAVSAVFYRADEPNTVYCSPNRLYQALARGCPVVVGSNPPMRDVVERTGAGVVADTDGADIEAVTLALQEALTNVGDLRENARAARGRYLWEAQTAQVFARLRRQDKYR